MNATTDDPIRVLILGPPYSGKNALIEGLARCQGTRVSRFEHFEGARRNAGGFAVLRLAGREVRVATLSGAVTSENAWLHFAERAARIVLALDSQDSRVDANLAAIDVFARIGPIKDTLVIWTKTDLTKSSVLPVVLEARLQSLHGVRWRVEACSSAQDDGAKRLLRWLELQLGTA